MKNMQNIKVGTLTKQGEKANKKVDHRYIILTSSEFRWYHNEQEVKQGKVPLGTIPLNEVYHCTPSLNTKSTCDFLIGAGSWKKGKDLKERREFKFGARNEDDRDDWITSIEFLKTKSVYDKFTKNFCNIQFPMIKQDTRKQKDESNRLVESLGTSLKNMDLLGADISRTNRVTGQPYRASVQGKNIFSF